MKIKNIEINSNPTDITIDSEKSNGTKTYNVDVDIKVNCEMSMFFGANHIQNSDEQQLFIENYITKKLEGVLQNENR